MAPITDAQVLDRVADWAHANTDLVEDHTGMIALAMMMFEVGLSVACTSPTAGRRILDCMTAVGAGSPFQEGGLRELADITATIVNDVV